MRTKNQAEKYRSNNISFVNETLLVFPHGWSNFAPGVDIYWVQPWAICTIAQAGYVDGDRVLLNGRRATITADSNNFYLQVGGNGISIGRKNNSFNEFNLNASRWQIYLIAERKIKF